MRRKTLARAAGCLLAAALTFSAAGPAVADDPADYSEISAAGPRAAWGLGTTGQSSYVAHWNGKRWTRMPVPPHLYGVAISGLSTSDVWLAGWLSGTDNRQSLV